VAHLEENVKAATIALTADEFDQLDRVGRRDRTPG